MPRSRRRTLAALVLAALCVALVVKLLPEATSPDDGVADAPKPDQDAPAPMLSGAHSEADGAAAVDGAEKVADDEKQGEPELEALRGTIVVTDPSGEKHAEESGEFTIYVRHHGGRFKELVLVEKGSWSVRAPPAMGIDVSDLKLGGRMACVTWDEIPVVRGQDLVIEAWWPRPSILHVEDEETGRPMLGLTLVQAGHFDDRRRHPSDGWEKRVAATEVDSPITLPDRDGTPTWFVWAPGYAWGSVSVDQRAGGEHRVALERGGDLEVLFTGELPPEDAWVIVRPADAAPKSEHSAEFRIDRHEPILIRGLPPDTYVLQAIYSRSQRSFALSGAVARGGEQSSVTLDLAPVALVPRVPLAGIVRFHGRQGRKPISLVLQSRDAALPPNYIRLERQMVVADPKRPGVFRWHAGKVAPGTWRVDVRPVGVMAQLTVGPAGLEDAVIDVPEICEVRLKLVDSLTREPADVMDVDFVRGTTRPPGRGAFLWDSDKARWVADAPVGAVRIDAYGRSYHELEKDLVLESGVNEHTFELERVAVVALAFRDGETVVPIDSIGYVRLVDEDDEDQVDLLYDREHQVLHLRAPKPGRYRLRVDAPEGFEDVPEREIELARAQQLEVTVQLERKP